MKWFRHFHNASSSIKIQLLIDELGVEGYGHYFLLLELLTEKFDGKSAKVDLHLDEICSKVRIKFSKKLEKFVQKLADFSLLSYEISGKVYKFDCPILLELQDKDSKYNRKKRSGSEKLANNRIKNKNIDKEEEEEEYITIVESDFDYTHPLDLKPDVKKFDLEKLYDAYPKKEGKKIGINRLRTIIKSEETYSKVLLAINNYSNLCKGKEFKYIKQFSSFVSVWEDYLDIQIQKTSIEQKLDENPFRS